MATNRLLRAALLEKLGVTSQRLSQLVQKRKRELPMTTEQATYTIAHERGIDIAKFLSHEQVAEVRDLVAKLGQIRGGQAPSPATTAPPRKETAPSPVSVSIAGMRIGQIPGLRASHAREAKQMAERAYPTLYVFENSVRDIVERVLQTAYGDGWWEAAVPAKVKTTAATHQATEAKEPWHGRRGAREIDYIFLTDLSLIVKHQWKHFKDVFPRPGWFEELVNDMNVSRRVIAHMNPLAEDDIKHIEAAFRKWVRQLEGVADKIP